MNVEVIEIDTPKEIYALDLLKLPFKLFHFVFGFLVDCSENLFLILGISGWSN